MPANHPQGQGIHSVEKGAAAHTRADQDRQKEQYEYEQEQEHEQEHEHEHEHEHPRTPVRGSPTANCQLTTDN